MNCNALKNHLLTLETPARPVDAAARRHLAECAVCQAWQKQLVRLERAAARLPVPPADSAREALLQKILEPMDQPTVSDPTPLPESRRSSVALFLGSLVLDHHASTRRRAGAGIVIGVAAALLLFIAGSLVWLGNQHPDPVASAPSSRGPLDTLVVDLRGRDLDAAQAVGQAKTATERVQALARVADEMIGRNRVLVNKANSEEMEQWADLFRRVNEDLVTRAQEVPRDQRPDILEPIAQSLRNAGSEAHRLSVEDGVPEASKQALARISRAANDTSQTLHGLCAVIERT